MSAEMPKMPEPFAKWWAEKGQFISAKDEGDFSLERDIAEASWQEAARQAMERCAEVCESRITGGIPLTRASNDFDCEAMACANAIRALLPQDPDHLAGVGNMVDGKDQSEKRHG